MNVVRNGMGVREKDLEGWVGEKKNWHWGNVGGVGALVGEPKEAMSGAWGRGVNYFN